MKVKLFVNSVDFTMCIVESIVVFPREKRNEKKSATTAICAIHEDTIHRRFQM